MHTHIHMNTHTRTHTLFLFSLIHSSVGSRQITHYPQTLQYIFIKQKISNRTPVYPSKSKLETQFLGPRDICTEYTGICLGYYQHSVLTFKGNQKGPKREIPEYILNWLCTVKKAWGKKKITGKSYFIQQLKLKILRSSPNAYTLTFMHFKL